MASIWDRHGQPVPDPHFERDLGPDARICRNCFHWGRQTKVEGRCRLAPDPIGWPLTHPEDSCDDFMGRARL